MDGINASSLPKKQELANQNSLKLAPAQKDTSTSFANALKTTNFEPSNTTPTKQLNTNPGKIDTLFPQQSNTGIGDIQAVLLHPQITTISAGQANAMSPSHSGQTIGTLGRTGTVVA